MADLKHGSNQFQKVESPIGDSSKSEGKTREEAAALLKVGTSSVDRARRIIVKGTPELAAAVESGEVTVNAASEIAKLPAERQREVLAEGPETVTH